MFPIAYAASSAQISAQCLVDKINSVFLFPLIGLLSALAFLIFLYGAFEYVKNASNDSARATGQTHLMYGIVGMLVMLSAYAILGVAAGTFGIGLNKIDCGQISSATNAAISTSPLQPGGGSFTGGYNPGADTSSSVVTPGFAGAPANTSITPGLGQPGSPDTPFTAPTYSIIDKVEMISCGNDPSCAIAKNDCNNHYDVQGYNSTGGRWRDIPPTPDNGNKTWMIECTYSVAVSN